MFWNEILQMERPEGQLHWPVSNPQGLYLGMESASGELLEVRPFYSDQHAVDALSLLAEHRLDSVAVVNQDLELLGGLSASRLSQWMGQHWCFQLPGSSIWLKDFQTLRGSVIQTLEEEGYRIVAMATDFRQESGLFGTWLRLDQPDPTAAAETLERMGITVLGSFPRGRRQDDAQDNLDHLLHYLSV